MPNHPKNGFARNVSFSDDEEVHEVPRVSVEDKGNCFYTKTDLRRFDLERKAEKQAEQLLNLEEMMAQANILMYGATL